MNRLDAEKKSVRLECMAAYKLIGDTRHWLVVRGSGKGKLTPFLTDRCVATTDLLRDYLINCCDKNGLRSVVNNCLVEFE